MVVPTRCPPPPTIMLSTHQQNENFYHDESYQILYYCTSYNAGKNTRPEHSGTYAQYISENKVKYN